MQVKVKIKDIIHQTHSATLFLISEKEVWMPNKLFRIKNGSIVLSKSFAELKGLKYTEYFHIPDKIEPKYNQEAIDELKC